VQLIDPAPGVGPPLTLELFDEMQSSDQKTA